MADKTIHSTRNKKCHNATKNNKAHGPDGIPGEVYKVLKNWIRKPHTEILQKIQLGEDLPPEWKNGTMVHIYKNKGKNRRM